MEKIYLNELMAYKEVDTKYKSTTSLPWGETDVIVKKTIPGVELIRAIQQLVNLSTDERGYFVDIVYQMCLQLLTIKYWTNIEIKLFDFMETIEQTDITDPYDYISGTGLYQMVRQLIDEEQISLFETCSKATIESIMNYYNSVGGIIERTNDSAVVANIDLKENLDRLEDPNTLATLKGILGLI